MEAAQAAVGEPSEMRRTLRASDAALAAGGAGAGIGAAAAVAAAAVAAGFAAGAGTAATGRGLDAKGSPVPAQATPAPGAALSLQEQCVEACKRLANPSFMPTRCRRSKSNEVSERWFCTDLFVQIAEPFGDAATGSVLWPLKDRKTGAVAPAPSTFLLNELVRFEQVAVLAFRRVDTDISGTIDVRELKRALDDAFGCTFSVQVAKVLLVAYDTNGNGSIDLDEFFPLFIRVSALKIMFDALHRASMGVARGFGQDHSAATGGIAMDTNQLMQIMSALDFGFKFDMAAPQNRMITEAIIFSAQPADGSGRIPFVELVRIVGEMDALILFWQKGRINPADPDSGFRLGHVLQLVYLHFVSRASSFVAPAAPAAPSPFAVPLPLAFGGVPALSTMGAPAGGAAGARAGGGAEAKAEAEEDEGPGEGEPPRPRPRRTKGPARASRPRTSRRRKSRRRSSNCCRARPCGSACAAPSTALIATALGAPG